MLLREITSIEENETLEKGEFGIWDRKEGDSNFKYDGRKRPP